MSIMPLADGAGDPDTVRPGRASKFFKKKKEKKQRESRQEGEKTNGTGGGKDQAK